MATNTGFVQTTKESGLCETGLSQTKFSNL
jgi:hypothetical protein